MLALQAQQQVEYLCLDRHIQRGRRLIGDDEIRIQAEGPASVESLPAAMDGLIRYYRLVAGEHPDWDDYRQAMEHEQRVLIRIQIERAGPSHTDKSTMPVVAVSVPPPMIMTR